MPFALAPWLLRALPWLAGLLLLSAGAAWMDHRGAERVRAEWAAREASIRAAIAEDLAKHQQRVVEAMHATAAEAAARAAAATTIRRAIADAPPSRACAASPAVRAVTDGLRARPHGAPGPPIGAARTADMRG